MALNRLNINLNNRSKGFAGLPILGLLLAFVSAVLLTILTVQVHLLEEKRRDSALEHADFTQLLINQNINKIQRQAAGFARNIASDTDSNKSFDLGESEQVDTLTQQLLTDIVQLVKVRVFSLNSATLDRDSSPPFSFASLDIVKRVESDNKQITEAIKDKNRWLVTIASPIRLSADHPVQGTLFLYLDILAIAEGMDDIFDSQSVKNLPVGQLQIVQSFGGDRSAEILSLGKLDQSNSASAPLKRKLNVPVWQLHYTPAPVLTPISQPRSLLLLTLPLIVFLVIAIFSVLIGIKRIKSTIRLDVEKLRRRISNLDSTGPASSGTYFHSELGRLESTITALVTTKDRKSATAKPPKRQPPIQQKRNPIETIFRANDIRGDASQFLTPEFVKLIGLAIGSEAKDKGEQRILVACDGRLSSPSITIALIEGLSATGINVITLGDVPTPLMYFATHTTDITSGVMVTGSHNPAEYNGFKIVIGGKPLTDDGIQALLQRIKAKNFTTGKGEISDLDIVKNYIDDVSRKVTVKQSIKVVVDCGNGIAGRIAPKLYSKLGCQVISLYCEVDGNFPNHPPDPTIPINLEDLIMKVRSEKAALGLAMDGDGDRVIAVTSTGQIVWPDQLLMLFARDILPRHKGAGVVYDVKCSRQLDSLIKTLGGQSLMAKSGHSFLKQKMMETDAILGGEFSGHICIAENWFGFDDGTYAGARLLELIGRAGISLDQLLSDFTTSISTPEILVRLDEHAKFEVVKKFKESIGNTEGTLTDLDGVRLDFPDGWGLVRASNTSPAITLRFEADTQDGLKRIRHFFRDKLQEIDHEIMF